MHVYGHSDGSMDTDNIELSHGKRGLRRKQIQAVQRVSMARAPEVSILYISRFAILPQGRVRMIFSEVVSELLGVRADDVAVERDMGRAQFNVGDHDSILRRSIVVFEGLVESM